MSIIDDILNKQKLQTYAGEQKLPEHKPEMLLIGCVDARKDPISDLGIEKGKALILRNIAALIRGTSVAASQRETEAAALEFAVKVMKVKHIVVMGHTDCAGIRASLLDSELTAIRNYLSPLNALKQKIQESDMPMSEKIDLMEIEAIKMSVQNLLSYSYIKQAVDEGRLSVNGWMLDVASGELIEIV